MNYSVLCCVCLASASVGQPPTLKEARQELQEGNYAEAREIYESLTKQVKSRPKATLGLSRAWESQGQYDKALAVIDTILKEEAEDADFHARKAELHHLRGQFIEAEKSAMAGLAKNKDHVLSHWVLGQVFRDRGNLKKADEHFLALVRIYNAKELTDPDDLRYIGLATLERARFHHITDQYQAAISDCFRHKAIADDKYYWQGEYEAGRVYMEKHSKPSAFKAFEKALIINPRAVEVLTCKGQMAANHMEFKDAEKYATQALKINPHYIPALLLMADVHWFSSELDSALKKVMKAREFNPRDEAALARLAAIRFAQKKDDELNAIIKEAETNNPRCYTFYADLGSLLEQRKFNADAEKYYSIAIEMQPKFAEAQTGLGMLYMRSAKEAEARKVLERAKAADPFNVRVFNSLQVLDHLDKYEALKTEHFIIRYDKKNDEVLANFMAIYLENIYKELAEQFDYRPKGPFQIQIFKRHDMFSGRVIAVPDLHTIGACTGPLVAMVSPHDTTKTMKLFNWNRVIRHELVHVFNLQQTNANVPHWFTEGLAVRYEGAHIPPSWHGLLAEKFHGNELLDLDNILLGFIRPRSPSQWQQAYLQSLLYVQYMTKTYGEKSVGKMLAAFEQGLETGPALAKVLNVKQADFEKGYREFLAEKVKDTPFRPVRKDQTLKQLREAHAKNPDDLDIAAQLAEKNYFLGKKKDAKELADTVLRKQPKNATAGYVKALLLIDENNQVTAMSLLASLTGEDQKDTRPIKLLAKIQLEAKKFQQAAHTAERGRKIDPNDTDWIAILAKAYTNTKQNDKLVEIFVDIARMSVDDLNPRKQLAKHHFDKGNHAEAAKYARMALEIDVVDADCQRYLVESLEAQNQRDEAATLRKIFGI